MSSMYQLRAGSNAASCSQTALRSPMPNTSTAAHAPKNRSGEGRRASHHASSGRTR